MTCDLHPVTGNLLYLCKELTTPDYRNLYRRVVDLGGSFFQQNQLQQQQSNQSANIPQNSLSEADVHMYHNVLASYHEAEDCVVAALENLFVALETRAERFDDHTKPRAMRRTLVGTSLKFLMLLRLHHIFVLLMCTRRRQTTTRYTIMRTNMPRIMCLRHANTFSSSITSIPCYPSRRNVARI